MSPSKVAFILGGGASRGAYQVGCLKRLEEEGVQPELMIGSSIGAINALLWVTGGADHAWGFWSKAFSLPRVLDISLRQNPLTTNSLFSMGRLARWVEGQIDFEKCYKSDIELSFIMANLTEGHEELRGNRTEKTLERFKKVTRIAYALPVIHPSIELDGMQYCDGGLLWNIPFEHAEELGAKDIYILSVVPSNLPRVDNLRFIPQVALRFYDMFWRTFGNSSHLEKHLVDGMYHDIAVTVVEPSPETGGFDPLKMLHAYPGKSKKLLWTGYNDMDDILRGKKKPRQGRIKGVVPVETKQVRAKGNAAVPKKRATTKKKAATRAKTRAKSSSRS